MAIETMQLDIAEQAAEALRTTLGECLVAVVLFGSRARGDASEYSDWDLLVIAEGLPERALDRHFALKQLLPPGVGEHVSIIAKMPAEFEAHVPSIYLDIALDGRVVYDPRGYARAKLLELQRLIERMGLYRRRTPDGDLWLWQSLPSDRWELRWESTHASE